jgi:hypothetical protein
LLVYRKKIEPDSRTSFSILLMLDAIKEPEKCILYVTTHAMANGSNLSLIKNQTEEVCLAAVRLIGISLKYVRKQTPAICMAAIKEDVNALEYVIEQTPEICLAAVKSNGNALQFVKEQNEEICLAAVARDGNLLQYVKEQTFDICMAAIKQNYKALKYVKEQAYEVCMAAVKYDGQALKYVKEQTEEMCILAFRSYSKQYIYDSPLQYVRKQTPAICIAAIKRCGTALQYVEEQTLEICIAAINNNEYSLEHVDPELIPSILLEIHSKKIIKLPGSIIPEECIDNITLEPMIRGNVYGFLKRRGKYYLVSSLDSIGHFIRTKFKGSSIYRVFVPFINNTVPISSINWVRYE